MLTKTLITLSLITSLGTITVVNHDLFRDERINSTQTLAKLSTADINRIAQNITVKVYAGSDRGSGILINNDNNTYTVLTNAHVTQRGDTYQIETPDGVKHDATIVTKDGTETGNDLAILEFNSSNTYQVAKLGNSASIASGENTIAAGFPDGTNQLLVTEGKITLLPKQPLKKGYSIGFSNQTSQGMSGGILLNSNGEVIAVLGKGKDAILDTAYDYLDGTQPSETEIAAFREVGFAIPIANLPELSPQLAGLLPGGNNANLARQSEYTGMVGKVDRIAEQITVRIAASSRDKDGSGVIIARQDNTYYVATAGHVVADLNGEYTIVTSDGATYRLDNTTIVKSDAYDFALLSFTSDKDYTVATLGNYNVAANDKQVIFVSGFPHHQSPQRIITGGKAIEQNETLFKTKDSYSLADAERGLLYTNISHSGMSGGAVLDTEGRVVGINTGAENELYDDSASYEQFSLGYSLGIPIQDIVGFLKAKTQFDTQLLQQSTNPAAPISDKDYSSLESQLFTLKKPDDNTDLVAWMNYGNLLWRYEKPTEAISAFDKAIKINPQFDKAYYAKSLAYFSQEQYPQAVTTLNKATHLNSNPYFYWRYLGLYYSRLERFENAFLAYEEAISKNAEDFVLYQEYGDVLDDAGQHNKAISSYDKALNLNPDHPWIYNNRGNAYYQLKQYETALTDYQNAIALNPQDPEAYNNIAIIHSDLEQYEKAILNYNKAIEFNPNYALAYSNRGATYHDMGKYNEALANYQKAIDLDPENADTYANRGLTYAKLQQYDKALTNYNKALEIAPQFAIVYHNRGLVYDDLGQYEKALADYNQALTINPQNAKTYTNRGLIYAAFQKYEKALADYNKAWEIDPNFSENYNNRGILYSSLGESDKALADFTQAITLNPEDEVAYYNRGTQYNLLEQYDKALIDFDKAISLNPQYTDVYINRGNAYKALQQYDAALADFNQALKIDPQLKEGYLKRSGIYQNLKQYDLAIADLQQLIKLNPQNAQTYTFIGLVYYELKDFSQFKNYFEQAANIYKQQGNMEQYNKIQQLLTAFAQEQQK